MSRLTHKKKTEFFKIIVERDGYACFYCQGDFSDIPPEYDHLNNNPDDSRSENLVFCHRACNNKKKTSAEWQVKANEKLHLNERAILVCERMLADTGSAEHLTSSQQISKSLRPISQQWLDEHLLMEREIILKDAVNAMVHLCQQQTGWGSSAAVYRYIDEWTNPYNGKYTLSKNDAGKIIIRKRTEN